MGGDLMILMKFLSEFGNSSFFDNIRFFYRKPLKSHTSPEIFGNSVHRWKTWNHRPRNVFLVEKNIKNLFLWYLDNFWAGTKSLIFFSCSGNSNCSSKTSENAWIFMKMSAFWWISLSELHEGKSQQPTRLLRQCGGQLSNTSNN